MITNDRETIFYFLILFQYPHKMTFAFSFHISPANAILNLQVYSSLQYLGLNLQNVWEMQQQQMIMMIMIIIQKMHKKRTWKHNIK
jgi:hypothetical protein